jgi:ribosomal protein S18 acetylase RimI-like enzyme
LDGGVDPLLHRLETFYDAVPGLGADPEEHGPLRLFLPRPGAWPYYARPAGPGAVVTVADVLSVRARQHELGLPESFEWVHDVTPSLTTAAEEAGLVVQRCPLLVLAGEPAPPPPGTTARLLGPDDDELALAEAIASVGFGAGIGTRVGPAGPAERDRALADVPFARLERLRRLLREGAVARAVAGLAPGPEQQADGELDGPLASGGFQRAGDVVEVVGVATLPAARRRGLAGAVTGALARAALDAGATTVFLSAQDDAVARVYERLGFRRVGTAGLAEPPAEPLPEPWTAEPDRR